MLQVALVYMGLLAALAADTSAASRDLKTYEALKLKAGKDPTAQVKLALWCEAHGLNAEQLEHLARAVLADPANATARGLLGLISFGGRWESAEKIGERMKADEERVARLADYNGRRASLEEKEHDLRAAVERLGEKGRPELAYAAQLKANREVAQAHASLGMWCDQHGLKPEAMAHFTTAVHLDPSRDASWRHLGYVKRNGRWISPRTGRRRRKGRARAASGRSPLGAAAAEMEGLAGRLFFAPRGGRGTSDDGERPPRRHVDPQGLPDWRIGGRAIPRRPPAGSD